MEKWVYLFKEGSADMRNLLGGKGANLAEMTNIGLPVPQGFTITTEACTQYYEDGREINGEIRAQIDEYIGKMEEITGKKFGDKKNPLLVSVRSGARASMPGMMDTILNLGLNEEVVNAIAEMSGNPRWAWDCYRRFIQMYSDVVMEVGKKYFEELIETGGIKEISPSRVWYESRTDFGEDQTGVRLKQHPDRGFELLQGNAVFSGKILGGCLDTIFDMFDGGRYADSPKLCTRYGLFPAASEWKGKILFLETSEEKMAPEKYQRAVTALKDTGVFGAVSGVIVGKPMDETYYEAYKRILAECIDNPLLPVVYNVNAGHALPRCIIPFGVDAVVDAGSQKITFGKGGSEGN